MVSRNILALAIAALAVVEAKPCSKAQSYAHATYPYPTITASPGSSSSMSSPTASSTTSVSSSTSSSSISSSSSMSSSSTASTSSDSTSSSSTDSSTSSSSSSSSETMSISSSTESSMTITTSSAITSSTFVPADLFPCTADSDCLMANQLCDDVRCGCLDLFCQPLTTTTSSTTSSTTTDVPPAAHTVAAPTCNSVGDLIPNGGCNDACVCQADVDGTEYCSSQFSFEDPSIQCTSDEDCPQGDFCEDLDGGNARCATGTQPGDECYFMPQ